MEIERALALKEEHSIFVLARSFNELETVHINACFYGLYYQAKFHTIITGTFIETF